MRDTAEFVRVNGQIQLVRRNHQIDQSTGQAAVFTAGEPAWHRLGQNVSEAQTAAEAIKLAVMDWEVGQWKLEAVNPITGERIAVDSRVANVRQDTSSVLGVVGNGYRVLQNAEAFAFMDGIVGDGLAHWETAGSIRGGRRIWMLCRLPGELKAAESDTILPYGLLTNSHDGSLAIHLVPTTVRVVCNNTLNLSLNADGKRGLTIRHSQSLKGKVEAARRTFGLLKTRMDAHQEEIAAMARTSLSGSQVRDYFQTFFPVKTPVTPITPDDGAGLLDSILSQTDDRRGAVGDLLEGYDRQSKRNAVILETLMENFENERQSLPGISGTAWAALNAVTEYVDYQKPVWGKTDDAKAGNRINSIWYGQGSQLKQNALREALSLTGR